jgi:4-hydroxy-3-polyprenylbenzoate decarboxylase
VLILRETPLHAGHCKLLYDVSLLGAIVAPPVPAFYNRPTSLDDVINHSVGRALDLFDIDYRKIKRWRGPDVPARAAN